MNKSIYVFKGKTSGLIKIGVSSNVAVRAYTISNLEKEEIEIIKSFDSEHYKEIESAAKWHFKQFNTQVNRKSKNEWFTITEIDAIDFIEKALAEIVKEPEHAPRWFTRYIKDCRNCGKDNKIWFLNA